MMTPIDLPHEGRRRRYLLQPAPQPGQPLLMVLHGTGGTAAWAEQELGWSVDAARHGFNLVLPDGLPPNPDDEPKFLSNPARWNDGSEFVLNLPTSPPDDVDFLDHVLQDSLSRTQADPQRVYLTGFSNGAGMAFRYASERAERLAAVAPVAGYCWVPAPRPSPPVPTLYLVGAADPLIPLAGGPARLPWGGGTIVERMPVLWTLQRWATGSGVSIEPQERRRPEGVRVWHFPGLVPFQAWIIPDLGHHWPGGKGQLNPRIGGKPSNLIRANDVLWQFFTDPRQFTTVAQQVPPRSA